ncbi:hypothetical protein Tco_0637818 [Tanacetum coccineum]
MLATPSPRSVSKISSRIWCRSVISSVSYPNEPKSRGLNDPEIHLINSLALSLGCPSDSTPFIYIGLPVGKKMRYVDGWAEPRTLVFSANGSGGFILKKRLFGLKLLVNSMGKMEDFVLLLARWVLGVSGVIFLKLSIDTSFKDSFVIKVGNGNNTLFWRDPWCSTGLCLVDIFPRPFALDTYKDCKVCDRWGAVNGVWGGMWSWRVPPMGRSLDDITTLSILIGDFRLLESEND